MCVRPVVKTTGYRCGPERPGFSMWWTVSMLTSVRPASIILRTRWSRANLLF